MQNLSTTKIVLENSGTITEYSFKPDNESEKRAAFIQAFNDAAHGSTLTLPKSVFFTVAETDVNYNNFTMDGNNCTLFSSGTSYDDLFKVTGRGVKVLNLNLKGGTTSGGGRLLNLGGPNSLAKNIRCLGTTTTGAGAKNPIKLGAASINCIVDGFYSEKNYGPCRDDGTDNTWKNGLVTDYGGNHGFTSNSVIKDGNLTVRDVSIIHTEFSGSENAGCMNLNINESFSHLYGRVTLDNVFLSRENPGALSESNLALKIQQIKKLVMTNCTILTGNPSAFALFAINIGQSTNEAVADNLSFEDIILDKCYIRGSINGLAASGFDVRTGSFQILNSTIDMSGLDSAVWMNQIDIRDKLILKNSEFINNDDATGTPTWFSICKESRLGHMDIDNVFFAATKSTVDVFFFENAFHDLDKWSFTDVTKSGAGNWTNRGDSNTLIDLKIPGTYTDFLTSDIDDGTTPDVSGSVTHFMAAGAKLFTTNPSGNGGIAYQVMSPQGLWTTASLVP